jgi:predicted nucleic acid-binding protein
MSFKYLLNTNILSEAKRPRTNEKVMEKLKLHRQEIEDRRGRPSHKMDNLCLGKS